MAYSYNPYGESCCNCKLIWCWSVQALRAYYQRLVAETAAAQQPGFARVMGFDWETIKVRGDTRSGMPLLPSRRWAGAGGGGVCAQQQHSPGRADGTAVCCEQAQAAAPEVDLRSSPESVGGYDSEAAADFSSETGEEELEGAGVGWPEDGLLLGRVMRKLHTLQAALAVGETVILLDHPLPLVGVSIGLQKGRQQNDSLADG